MSSYFYEFTGQNNGGTASQTFVSIGQKSKWLPRICIINMWHAWGTNFKGSDSRCLSVYFLFCAYARNMDSYILHRLVGE
jgi:hypothetical protein